MYIAAGVSFQKAEFHPIFEVEVPVAAMIDKGVRGQKILCNPGVAEIDLLIDDGLATALIKNYAEFTVPNVHKSCGGPKRNTVDLRAVWNNCAVKLVVVEVAGVRHDVGAVGTVDHGPLSTIHGDEDDQEDGHYQKKAKIGYVFRGGEGDMNDLTKIMKNQSASRLQYYSHRSG